MKVTVRKSKRSSEKEKHKEKKSHDSVTSKKSRKKQLEKFKEERELQMKLHKIIRIQALFRGAIARKHQIRHIKQSSHAARLVVDSLIEKYIDSSFIPDILLEIVTLNKITENFDLYSPQTQVLMEVRSNLITKVIKSQTEGIAKAVLSLFVD